MMNWKKWIKYTGIGLVVLTVGCTNEQKKFPVFLSCETIKKKQGIGPKTCLKLEIINGKTKQ